MFQGKAVVMKPFVLLVVAAIAWSSVASSQDEPKATDLRLENSFIYADLMVEGVVEKITTVTVPPGDYAPGSPGLNMPVAIILFRVNRVLLGYPQPERIEIVARKWGSPSHYCFDLQEGDRYILNLHYGDTGKLFEPGRYFTRDDSERFLVKNSEWIQGRKDQPLARGELKTLYDAIQKAAEERSLEVLTHRADLIVRGRVVEIANPHDLTATGQEKNIQKVRLVVDSTMKGKVKDYSIIISMINVGLYEPSWRTRVSDMHIGEEWIAFLKYAEEPGYYPFAGVNGLFMIKGDKLIRNNNNQLATTYSPKQLELEVRAAVAERE
jgi:hypothetical protein